MVEPLRPDETELRGDWIKVDGHVVGDPVSARIAHLIAHELVESETADAGWSTLYRDPTGGRYWELSYPRSEMHGGGPRDLIQLDLQTVEVKYGVS